MQDFTPEQIQQKFDQLTPEMQEAISSQEIHDKIRAIGTRRGLMINQIGELVDQVGLVMLGLAKSSDFVNDTSERLSVNAAKAREIAEDINTDIFSSLKNILMGKDPSGEKIIPNDSAVSKLERAGNFKIEPTVPYYGAEETGRTGQGGTNPFTGSTQKNALPGIKNPMKEPLVDQLLRGAAASPEQKIDMDTRPSNPQPPRNLPTNDPYREPMK